MHYFRAAKGVVYSYYDNKLHYEETALRLDMANEIDVPPVLWKFYEEDSHQTTVWRKDLGGRLKQHITVYHKSESFWLKDLRVVLMDEYKHAQLEFKDHHLGRITKILLTTSTAAGRLGKGINSQVIKVGVYYSLQVNEEARRLGEHRFKDVSWGFPNFRRIENFALFEQNMSNNQLSFGLTDATYEVCYRDRLLDGRSLALLVGPWGILLGDDFSFDALVLLNGAKPGMLDIGEILYTTNPYLVKQKFLGG